MSLVICLAHSHIDEISIQNEHNFIELLTQYLGLSHLIASHDDTNKELAVVGFTTISNEHLNLS